MNVNKATVELIKHFESCLQPLGGGMFGAYPDPAHGWKIPTIGWGTIVYPSGKAVKKGDIISQEEADNYLEWEIDEKADAVAKMLEVKLNEDQFGALVSFAYNAGINNLKRSTLLKLINIKHFDLASKQFEQWVWANGEKLPGLHRRRLSEKNLFLSRKPVIVTYTNYKRGIY